MLCQKKVPTASASTSTNSPPSTGNAANRTWGRRITALLCPMPIVQFFIFLSMKSFKNQNKNAKKNIFKLLFRSFRLFQFFVFSKKNSGDDACAMIANAGLGAAGQRCMALSVAVFVGEADKWIPRVAELAKQFTADVGTNPDAHLGPMVN